jgi:hypothetical protein
MRAAAGLLLGYAEQMPSPSRPASGAFALTGRAKWFWIAVVVALGAWLLILLVIADEGPSPALEPKAPLGQTAGSRPRQFAGKAENAFNQRREVRSSRPSSAVPFPANDRVDDGQGK